MNWRLKMSDKDDFVEDLFRNLPKAPPMSELDLRRHEKTILAHVDQMKKEQARKQGSLYGRFQTQFQLAAGFLVLVGGIGFVTNQSNFNTSSEVAISKPTPATPEPSAESSKSSSTKTESKPTGSGNSGSTSGQFESNYVEGSEYISNSGMNYQSEIQQIKAKIKLSSKPIAISTISSSYGKCAIELGINEDLLAIDKGTYDGESVLAFFYGNSRADMNIWVVTKSCKKITQY
jgi:hypothetical protein